MTFKKSLVGIIAGLTILSGFSGCAAPVPWQKPSITDIIPHKGLSRKVNNQQQPLGWLLGETSEVFPNEEKR